VTVHQKCVEDDNSAALAVLLLRNKSVLILLPFDSCLNDKKSARPPNAVVPSRGLCVDHGTCNVTELSLYGEVARIKPDSDSLVRFGTGFGDFGHNVHVEAWKSDGTQVTEFYNSFDHECPSTNSATNGSDITLPGGCSQSQIFAFRVPENSTDEVTVVLASRVRPIHPNKAPGVIHIFFLVIAAVFLTTGFLQFYFFRQAIPPAE
jgi:hypothetical protein